MRVRRRILIGVGILIPLVLFSIYWVIPVGLSIWTIWKSPHRAKIVPTEMDDSSISQAAGRNVSYFGYEFEVPWSDVDSETKVSPNRVIVAFHSGLKISATALPAKEFISTIASEWFRMSPQAFESQVGYEATHSDYEFLKRLYAFTPEKMNLWAASPSVHFRDSTLLHLKSITLLPPADSGIFDVHNAHFQGFQQGNTKARPAEILVSLYSGEGGLELIFKQENYQDAAGVSQAEINRVIESLHKAPQTP